MKMIENEKQRKVKINKSPIKAIIMAGGVGSRIRALEPDLPKPLIQINSKPILQYEIECLVLQGYTDIIITVSHKAKMVMDYFGNGSAFGCSISYYVEKTLLGNAGALFKLWELGELEEDSEFLLINGDSIFDIDFGRFITFHRLHHGMASLFTHPNTHPYDSGLIITEPDNSGRVKRWLTKEDKRPLYYKNRVNAGIHVINTAVLQRAVNNGINIKQIGRRNERTGMINKIDLDRQLLKPLADDGLLYAYDSPEYVKDMGTPKRFTQVADDLASGLVTARNLNKAQRAIFLDRDGTINKYVGFLRDPQQVELLPRVAEAIGLINQSGYLCIVITNQPVIARGEITIEELQMIHDKLETLLGQSGGYIDALYYCPHHPDKGFEGENISLKINCNCRKPNPGLLLQAAQDYNIDLEKSWMIGDGWRDIEAGKSAGTHTALLTGERAEGVIGDARNQNSKREIVADFSSYDLMDAVMKIMKEFPIVKHHL